MTKWDLSIKRKIKLHYYREKNTKITRNIVFGRWGGGGGVWGQFFADFGCLDPNPGERKQGRLLLQLTNKRPTWCHLLFYFTSYVLNMFRTLIYAPSGACDYSVELPHWSYCSWFDVCWSFGVVRLEWYPCCRLKLQPVTRILLQPNHTETPTHIEPRTIRPMW